MSLDLSFDIGGTFTDLALIDTSSGQLSVFKVLTTPGAPARGALAGIRDFLNSKGLGHESLSNILHATTLVANTLIEHKGALVGLVTTRGFRDIIEMRTEQRYDIYDLFLQYPPPLSPRYLRRGVRERTDRDGRILDHVDPDEIRRTVVDLRAQGAEAIAIAFLHAFRNPVNEQQALEVIQAEWPEVPVSLSSRIAPEIREYERTITTVANAYVQPLLRRYLQTIGDELKAANFQGNFYPMLSSGHTTLLSEAIEHPIQLVESGPAAGAIAAAHYGRLAGHRNLLSFDMGGTTAKLCLIHDGRPDISPRLEVARVQRFKPKSGYPLLFPTVDMLEIGAGGGSIAWIDSLGLLKIGPESAGADPGPAAYDFGGQEPTVTDADLVLGYLNPDYFLGGEMGLNLDTAQAAIARIAEAFGWSQVQAADGIHRLVNENMASAAKIHVLEKARDPRKYAIVCFGGAGPVHAAGMAKILGSPEVIVPPSAGVASAIGLLIAPTAFAFARSHPIRLSDADWMEVEGIFQEMEARGLELVRRAGIPDDRITIQRSVDGRFEGQLYEIQIALPGDLTGMDVADFTERFMSGYESLYRHLPSHTLIELLTCRVSVSGGRTPVYVAQIPPDAKGGGSVLKGSRPAYFAEAGGFVNTPIYDRYHLVPGTNLPGPSIVEERESTAIIQPGMRGYVDEHSNLHIYLRGN
jgi:N-methylhydantoinase A/oxoprolinase/acetone carboxylase beta subunit